MDASFWREKWARNQIAFHEAQVNPLLVAHFQRLALPAGSRIFVPLCGKTLDIPWLLARGHRVAGIELSEIAVQQLFRDLGVTPRLTVLGTITRYSAPGLDIFHGDIFDLSRDGLGAVDAVYDRAALVALPETCAAGNLARPLCRAPGCHHGSGDAAAHLRDLRAAFAGRAAVFGRRRRACALLRRCLRLHGARQHASRGRPQGGLSGRR
jgi:hypothetical protein